MLHIFFSPFFCIHFFHRHNKFPYYYFLSAFTNNEIKNILSKNAGVAKISCFHLHSLPYFLIKGGILEEEKFETSWINAWITEWLFMGKQIAGFASVLWVKSLIITKYRYDCSSSLDRLSEVFVSGKFISSSVMFWVYSYDISLYHNAFLNTILNQNSIFCIIMQYLSKKTTTVN